MSHALIIEDNMIVGQAIQQQLAHAGFRSFDHAWTETQAIGHAKRRTPDLVVIGDGIEQGSVIDTVRAIGGREDIPVLLATTERHRTDVSLPSDITIFGPCRIDEITQMVADGLSAASRANLALT